MKWFGKHMSGLEN